MLRASVACAAAAVVLSLAGGCGGGESKPKEQERAGAVDEYQQKSKRTEADLNLGALLKSAKVHYIEQAQYPKGKAGFTPSAPCCDGPNHKCPVSRDQWTSDPVWSALDFDMQDPGYFQYAYESDGNQLTAIARGDLDCDGNFIEYKLTCTATDGNPQCTIQKPDNQD